MVLSRIAEEEPGSENQARGSGEGQRAFRPQEDPWLVGEEAAERARRERLQRERYLGEEVLLREDRRWDWFLGKPLSYAKGREEVNASVTDKSTAQQPKSGSAKSRKRPGAACVEK